MDAIVLVGGLGTRLRPLTETRHKSLVPVRNRPAIDYLFDWAERSGFERGESVELSSQRIRDRHDAGHRNTSAIT